MDHSDHKRHGHGEHTSAGSSGQAHPAAAQSSATSPVSTATHSGHGSPIGQGGTGPRNHHDHHAHMVADFRKRFWVSLALTVPAVALAEMIQMWLGLHDTLDFPGDAYLEWVVASVIFFYGGWPFLAGFKNEIADRKPGMMTLIALAITVAYAYSSAVVFGLPGNVFFWETATLIDVMLLGHWIEMRSVMGASAALESLVRLMPSEAHRVRQDGSAEDVPVTKIHPGDRLLVKPGEKVPLDAIITQGRTAVNQSMLTGESKPVEKEEGDEVIGGSVNGDSAIVIEVRKTGGETYLAQVIEMVRKAQESRSRTQDLANRAALWLTIIAITVGGATLAVWLALGHDFTFGIERAVTVMVIACPHALGLAVPLVVAVSTAISAQNGLLIRDRSAFERSRNVNAMLFDKTGTLTEGRFGVTDIVPLTTVGEAELLIVAASLESQSEHPIAQGIVESAKARGLSFPAPASFTAIPGRGAEAIVEGKNIKVVSPGYLRDRNLQTSDPRITAVAEQGKTVVYVLINDRLSGAIALADVIRKESRDALRRLKDMGIQTMMITGDAKPVAAWVARDLGLDDYFAEVLPEQKADKVKEVQQRGLIVAMTGDGVNDAPALTQADIGIAVGAGTDVAIESADIVLVRSDPRDVMAIMFLARATYRKMVQNLIWATGYNVVAIPLAAGVLYRYGILLSPAVGAALMAVSTVVVAINARLLRVPELRG